MDIGAGVGATAFRRFRFRLKEIAQQNLVSVEGGRIIGDAAFHVLALAGEVPPDALVVFIDDDDWLAPHLFARFREFAAAGAGVDGFRWGPVRLGRDFKLTMDADAAFALRPTLTLRPIDRIYTTSYQATRAPYGRLVIAPLFDHF